MTTTLDQDKSDVFAHARDPAEVGARKRAQARRRWIKRGLGLALALGAVVALVVAARPRPTLVELVAVRRGPLEVSIEEAGRTRVRDRYIVLAPIGGELVRITLRAGDPVERGKTLARIVPGTPALLDPRSRAEAAARLAASRAAAEQARVNVTRAEVALEHARSDGEDVKKLVASGSARADDARNAQLDVDLRVQELASAKFGAEMAAHEVEVATAVLRRYGEGAGGAEAFEVASPITGRALRIVQGSAGVVLPSTPLLELGDPSEVEVVVDVLTEDAVRIPPHAKVVLDRWGGPWPLAGHVRVVEPSAFTRISALGVEEQRVSVVIDFDEPLARRAQLGDGYRVEARIVTWEGNDVVTVPSSAAFRQGDGWAVFVAEGERARRQRVELGRRSASEVQVLSGVVEGERVVVHPSDKVDDGARIVTR